MDEESSIWTIIHKIRDVLKKSDISRYVNATSDMIITTIVIVLRTVAK